MITHEPYSISSLVQTAATAMEPLAKVKGLELRISMPDSLPAGRGNERRLTQVLINLVGNAIKFTEAGWIEIAAHVDGDRLTISVTDTGVGISPEDQKVIFGAFQQGSSTLVPVQGGTGLGLAISKRLVEMHGGSISFRSVVGYGSTFIVDLPLDCSAASRKVA